MPIIDCFLLPSHRQYDGRKSNNYYKEQKLALIAHIAGGKLTR